MQLATGVGRLDLFSDVVEQRHADLLFQLAHLHRDRWLGQVQSVRGARKALLMHHSVEDLELSKGQMHGEYIRDSNASDQK
jgi:hypothetical protein